MNKLVSLTLTLLLALFPLSALAEEPDVISGNVDSPVYEEEEFGIVPDAIESEHAYQMLMLTDHDVGDSGFDDSVADIAISAPDDTIVIDETSFPDKGFRRYVMDNIDLNKDGLLTVGERTNRILISVESMGISSLKGIEFFPELTNINVNNNPLSSLDLSENTKLEKLNCQSCQLLSLNICNNTELKILNCSLNQLTSLDIRKNTKLETLNCQVNQLSSLNIKKNHVLSNLACWQNSISTLDISNCPELIEASQTHWMTVLSRVLLEGVWYSYTGGSGSRNNSLTVDMDTTLIANSNSSDEEDSSTVVTDLSIAIGKKESVQLFDQDGKKYDAVSYTFSSSNKAIATVSAKGIVKGMKKGNATIVVKANDGSRQTNVKVAVKPAPKSVSLSPKSKKLSAGFTLQLRPKVNSDAASYKMSYSSSNPKVAKVNASGLITACKEGKAIITVSTFNGIEATCTIKVRKLPETITISPSSISMGINETKKLKATITKGAASKITFRSDDDVIATVDSNGMITAVSPGSTVIRVSTYNGKTAKCIVTVMDEPKTLSLTASKSKLTAGHTIQINPIFSKGACGSIKYSSSNKAVATVDSNGLVTGIGQGSATITGTSYNGLTAKLKLTVRIPVYRALLIAETNYTDGNKKLSYTQISAKKMESMLKSFNGLGGFAWNVKRLKDRKLKDIGNDIISAFKGAHEDDISLFYFAGHGAKQTDDKGKAMTGLNLVDGCFDAAQLIDYFNAIPGKIVLIIDSCYSGGMIQQKGIREKGTSFISNKEKLINTLNGHIIDEASRADSGIRPKNGEFCTDKYYVITACRYDEISSDSRLTGGLFTNALAHGLVHINNSEFVQADFDSDRKITLNELYLFAYAYALNNKPLPLYKDQHAQVYPRDCDLVLFEY